MKKYCLALDLVHDAQLIQQYEQHHTAVWPEILESIKDAGIEQMEIYRLQNRLFMIMQVSDDFTFERKAAMDIANAKVQQWEQLMWKYQQAIHGGLPTEKWQLMTSIFSTTDNTI